MANLPQIQGKTPDSKEEVWIAEALYQFQIPFVFQYSILGGSNVRTGMIIDFLITKPPTQTPLEFFGDHWHENELPGGDLIRLKAMEDYFGVVPLIIWGKDAPTKQAVSQWVRKNIA